jgi:transcription elongation GreA/GreB family factor
VRDADDAERWYFVGPASGGLRVEVEGTLVRVVTPASPLGAALIGAEPGDEVLDAEGRPFEVVSIDGVGARAIEV